MSHELDVTVMPACLTYMTPARGGWSVVRRALLLPESYLFFIGMPACMRHIILSSLELGVQDRLSFIALNDANLATGGYEDTVVEEIANAIPRLGTKPRVVRIFFTCMDDLLGTDHASIIDRLHEQFPELIFTVSHMNPIRADSPIPPPIAILCDLFGLLEKPADMTEPGSEKRVNFIANNIAVPREDLICRWLTDHGYTVQHIAEFKTFNEFQRMARAELNIVVQPIGLRAADEMETRLRIPFRYCPYSYAETEIETNFKKIAEALAIDPPEFGEIRAQIASEAKETAVKLADFPVVIDYAATYRPFSMALFLQRSGIAIREIYASEWLTSEDSVREALLAADPTIKIIDPSAPARIGDCKSVPNAVAIGFESAYLTGAQFVLPYCADEFAYGYDAQLRLLRDLRNAVDTPIDLERAVKESGYTV